MRNVNQTLMWRLFMVSFGSPTGRYILRRLLQAVIVVIGVSIFVFLLTRFLPGGEARAILGARATPAQVANFNQVNGLNAPWPVQYFTWVGQMLHLNFGYSYALNESVGQALVFDIPRTVVLVGSATVISMAIAVPLGVYQAVRRNKIDDYVLTAYSFIFYSMPTFWLGLTLITIFAVTLNWFPTEAPQSSGEPFFTFVYQMFLPVATLSLVQIASYSRYMRSSTLDAMVQDYVRTARAKGLSAAKVLRRHIVRNALIPIVTLLGLSLPAVFSGALITEAVFNYPGMGDLFIKEAVVRDYPTLLAITLIVAVATVIGSLIADLLYAVVDPRVRY